MAILFWMSCVASIVLVMSIDTALERTAKQKEPGWSMTLIGFCIFLLFWCAVSVVVHVVK